MDHLPMRSHDASNDFAAAFHVKRAKIYEK